MPTVTVTPETEARLRQLAQEAGKDLVTFLADLIVQAAATTQPTSQIGSVADFDRALDELFAADTRHLPSIRSTYPRDESYSDHD
jgi:hypothetical protein